MNFGVHISERAGLTCFDNFSVIYVVKMWYELSMPRILQMGEFMQVHKAGCIELYNLLLMMIELS